MADILEVDDSFRAAMFDMLSDERFRQKLKQDQLAPQKWEILREAARTEDPQIAIPKLYRAAMEGDWEEALRQFHHNQSAKTAKISNIGMTALHVAASCGQYEFVQKLVEELVKKQVARLQLEARDQLGRTALHHVAIAADVDAAKAMVTKNPILPYLGDMNRLTPLFYAAKWRHPSERKKMVEYLYRVSRDEILPRDLLEGRDVCNAFTDASAPDLIVAITASGSYDTALRILERYPELALKKNPEGTSIFHVLAMKPKAFRSGNELSPLMSWIYDLVPIDDEDSTNRCSAASFIKYMSKFIKGIREMSKIKQSHVCAVRLVKFVCDELHKKEKEEEEEKKKGKDKEMDFVRDFFVPENSIAILHLAVEHGVFELVDECLKAFPDLIWYADKLPQSVPWRHAHYTSTVKGSLVWNDTAQHADTASAHSTPPVTKYTDTTSGHWKWHEGQYADTANHTGRLLLHVAIEHRRAEIFNYLITLIGKNTKAYADLKLEGNNNSLHLAANLAPALQLQSIPGPAFQMQKEFQWFRAVEELVYDELKTKKNLEGKTPREVFFDAHEELLKNAKEWMKDTSNSCMVVGALVATVSFAAVITVPGGNDNDTGIAVLARNKLFMVFLVFNTISLANSAASLLMFLSVQTSRYTEEDFLESLPQTFVRGLFVLFIAIVTMVISFGTAIGLSLQSSFNWAYIATFIVACFPAIILGMSHLPLLLPPAAGPAISRGQRDREHWFRRIKPWFLPSARK